MAYSKKSSGLFSSYFGSNVVNLTLNNKKATVKIDSLQLSIQKEGTYDVRRIKQDYENEMNKYVENLTKTREVITFNTFSKNGKFIDIELTGFEDDIVKAKANLVEMAKKLQVTTSVNLGNIFFSENSLLFRLQVLFG